MKNKAFFVVGTGTDVGKTYVAALAVKKLSALGSVAYYKAAMSGDESDAYGNPVAVDARFVKAFSGIAQSVQSMCPYVYGKAYSPHLAARVCGRQVEMHEVLRGYEALGRTYDYTVVEGSGGIVCPLRYDGYKIFLADVIAAMDIPCVLVTDAGLGAINAVVLTVNYMQKVGLKISGVIYNCYKDDEICNDNIFMCEELTGVKTIAKVRRGDGELDCDVRDLFGGEK